MKSPLVHVYVPDTVAIPVWISTRPKRFRAISTVGGGGTSVNEMFKEPPLPLPSSWSSNAST